MQALMGKGSKVQTPQEIYKAKKQKEEDERNAFLPPGLVNHGNTCFMNSVLQGLMATPMLVDIVRFSLPETYAPVFSHRSPQLTNGHGLGGAAVERDWEQGMPLGDTFLRLMQRAWRMQDERQRSSMSPRDLLQRIGAKFDQYLDFRQQDAHEFLRHLLDAMRMEELDIIKQRQPPPPKAKRRRKNKSKSQPLEDPSSSIPEEERLVSFVDMVFGGRLASILVCEKCKKISCTYEDFNDLSLSIKQEDYEKARKRDRLKTLARKLGMRGRGSARESELDVLLPNGPPRSSSVPSSPLRRSEEAERSFELSLGDVGTRRRSLEAGEERPSLDATLQDENSLDGADVKSDQRNSKEDRSLLGIPEAQKTSDEDESSKREKDEDGWIKLRRKISVGMGVKKGKRKNFLKEKDTPPPVPPHDPPSNEDSQADATTGDEAIDSFVNVKAPSPMPVSPAASPLLGASIALQKFSFVRRPSSTRTGTNTNTNSPALSAITSPSRSPDIPSISLPPQETRPSSPSPTHIPIPHPHAIHVRSKSPRPPKLTRSESAYLRRLLADVPSSSHSGGVSSAAAAAVPFNLFRTGPLANSSPDISDIRGTWPKMGHVQSVEGCLKMFTAVEVLDGENMVGCRRCWKIQHGEYVPRKEAGEEEENEDEDEEEDTEEEEEVEEAGENADEEREDGASSHSSASSSSSASVKISLADSDVLQPPGLPIIPTTRTSKPSSSRDASIDSIPFPRVPSISMTEVESRVVPADGTSTASVSRDTNTNTRPSEASPASSKTQLKLISSPSRDSLQLPRPRHSRQPAAVEMRVTTSASSLSVTSDASSVSSDESDEGDEGDETSMRSDSSSIASTHLAVNSSKSTVFTNASPDLPHPLSTTDGPGSTHESEVVNTKSKRQSIRLPRPKQQVILRRAYKRYLIASPPPVLVIHLKRFQQVGSSPRASQALNTQFFANFKKLDDPVRFGEYLDLAPFLLPVRGEEETGKKGGRRRRRGKEKEKDGLGLERGEKLEDVSAGTTDVTSSGCMYRLYAVVVHIGNMLGGHYIAYTALPEPSSPPPSPPKDSSSSLSSSIPDPDLDSTPLRPSTPRTLSFSHTSKLRGAPAQRQWCYVSDTVVRLASLEEVLSAKAYICMYERV